MVDESPKGGWYIRMAGTGYCRRIDAHPLGVVDEVVHIVTVFSWQTLPDLLTLLVGNGIAMVVANHRTFLYQFQNLKSVNYQKSYLNCVESERKNIHIFNQIKYFKHYFSIKNYLFLVYVKKIISVNLVTFLLINGF